MGLSATVKASINAQQTRSIDLGAGQSSASVALATAFTDGAGAGQCNVLFADQRTIAASGSENLDLSGSLTYDGQSAVFARVKAIIIKASSDNTNNVNVSQPASNGVPGIFLAGGDGVSIRPGGVFMWMAPDATGAVVTAGTGDLLTVANSGAGTSVTYDVLILGAAS